MGCLVSHGVSIELHNIKHEVVIDEVKNKSVLTKQQVYDFINFEGNAQALRLLTKLHFFIDQNGMNLTYGVLNSIIKYPRKSTEVKSKKGISFKKMGYFSSEEEIFNDIVDKTGVGKNRNPLVFLLEAADDIAYKAADIEDGLKKGVLNYRLIYKSLMDIVDPEIFKEYQEILKLDNDEERKEKLNVLIQKNYNIRFLANLDRYYKCAQDYKYEDPETYAIQRFRVSVQGLMMSAVVEAFLSEDIYIDIMNGDFENDLLGVSKAREVSEALKSLAVEYIFSNKNVTKLEVIGHKVISGLLDIFVKAVISENYKDRQTFEGKIYHLISTNYKFVNEKFNSEEFGNDESYYYNKLLLVTDFICSMTDSYALELYQELTGVKL